MRIVDVPLGEGQEPGDAGELAEVGNEAFLAAVVGGEFELVHRSTGTLLAAPGSGRWRRTSRPGACCCAPRTSRSAGTCR
ncbi:hypothetical protein [Streptomyces sp. Y1]|uniref:Uncharacterized protein n=1 Tax=Streptomyces sp. Y1 TaxID=3238634 RepID=A0AB39TGS6_9ACTN